MNLAAPPELPTATVATQIISARQIDSRRFVPNWNLQGQGAAVCHSDIFFFFWGGGGKVGVKIYWHEDLLPKFLRTSQQTNINRKGIRFPQKKTAKSSSKKEVPLLSAAEVFLFVSGNHWVDFSNLWIPKINIQRVLGFLCIKNTYLIYM